MGKEGADRKAAVAQLGQTSANLQGAYRKLHHAYRSIAKSAATKYDDLTMQPKDTMHNACETHQGILNNQFDDAFRAGFVTKAAYAINVKAELNDILIISDQGKSQHRLAARASAAKGFADTHRV